ncbi:T9SS type A sorting domain-containing protein [Nonlabens agnitus]|uniref:Secretion system C-terminal sorting domain-containing protein n=1 Tax=Nonlabens agnitus TaxID=870484 RepID=A0A2S9WQP8_9FLAO|nr:T9SS type A sorting domain-containing protein [Nonlabens agnitus]PRP65783.1 hypothetical protein BST86_01085 [Nonlabens agnitus]
MFLQAQTNLVVNGDFESGSIAPWTGNAANLQTDNGNSFNFANVATAGQAFTVNLSQVLTIEQGATYTMTFDASSDRNRTMLAGIGQNAAPFNADVKSVSLTTANTSYSLTLLASNFGDANCRVIFDMGADVGVVVIDNVTLTKNEGTNEPAPAPEVAAPNPPARNSADYFSIFSDAYTNQPDVVFGAFDVGTQNIEEVSIQGNNTLKITTQPSDRQFLFTDWGTVVDNSEMTNFHMDYWIQTDFATGLVANPKLSNHDGNNGETSAIDLNNPVTTLGEWVSYDVALPAGAPRNALRQFVLTVVGAEPQARTIYLDNVYLYKQATASTENVDLSKIRVYPNPSSDVWNIVGNDVTIQSVDLYSTLGNKVSSQTVNGNSLSINNSALSNGIYFAKLNTSAGSTTIKLIKK